MIVVMFFQVTDAEKGINTKKEILEVACLGEENYEMLVQCTKKTLKSTKIT